jgi:hypothetical protein
MVTAPTDRPPVIRGLRYDRMSVIGDILRGGVGGVIVLAPVASLALHWAMQGILIGLGLLFWWFALRNTMRLQTRVDLLEDSIIIDGISREQLHWRELTAVHARYFSTRRDRSDGWLQLTIEGHNRQKMVIDSAIMDFDQLAEHVAYHAQRQGLEIDVVTAENLTAIGVPARYFIAQPAAQPADAATPHQDR